MFGVALMIIFDVSDELREMLELVAFPDREFQKTIITTLLLDFALCWGIEKTMKNLYLRKFNE